MRSGEVKVDENTKKTVIGFLHSHGERAYSWGTFYGMSNYKTGFVYVGRGRRWGLNVYPNGSVTRVN